MKKNVSDYLVIDPKLPHGVRAATERDLRKRNSKLVKTEQYARMISDKTQVKAGMIVEFQRDFGGFIGFLGFFMKLFNHRWDNYGWHVGWVTHVERDGQVRILEAQPLGAREVRIENFYDKKARNYRFWNMLGREATREEVKAILNTYEGVNYSFTAYFWTALMMIFRFPERTFGNRLMCWQLVYYIFRDLGAPIGGDNHNRPILADMNLACRGLIALSKRESERYAKRKLRGNAGHGLFD